jgi:hypothetical protein
MVLNNRRKVDVELRVPWKLPMTSLNSERQGSKAYLEQERARGNGCQASCSTGACDSQRAITRSRQRLRALSCVWHYN